MDPNSHTLTPKPSWWKELSRTSSETRSSPRGDSARTSMHRSQSLVDLEDFQHKSSTGEEIPGEAIGIAQSASSLQSTQHHCSDAKDLPSLPDDEDEDLLAVDMELDGDVSDEQGVAGLPTKKFECSICHDEYIANEMLAYYCHCERKLCYNCLESSFKAALSWHETGYAPRCLCSTRILFNDVAHQFTSSFLEEHGVRIAERVSTHPIYCAKNDCSAFLIDGDDPDGHEGFETCKCCKDETCLDCRNPREKHVVGKQCPENVFEKSAAEILGVEPGRAEHMGQLSLEFCRCRCGHVVQQIDGCDHLICPECQWHFCGECNEEWHCGRDHRQEWMDEHPDQ